MANSNQQTGENPQRGRIITPTRLIVSRVDSAVLLILRFILPILFLITLLIAGTLAISYTFYLHQPLPEHFTLAISVTFGLLLILTSAFLILFHARRINKRRASIDADPEANRPRRSVHFVSTSPRTRNNSPDHDYFQSSRSELGVTPTGSPSLRGGEQPRMLQGGFSSLSNERSQGHSVHVAIPPPHPAPLASCLPLLIHNPPRAEQPSLETSPSSNPAPLASLPPLRIHSPPPSNDHPAFYLPPPGPPVLFPKARTPAMKKPSVGEEEGYDWEAINLNTKPWWEGRR